MPLPHQWRDLQFGEETGNVQVPVEGLSLDDDLVPKTYINITTSKITNWFSSAKYIKKYTHSSEKYYKLIEHKNKWKHI